MVLFKLKDISARQPTMSFLDRNLVKVHRIRRRRKQRRDKGQAHHGEVKTKENTKLSRLRNHENHQDTRKKKRERTKQIGLG